MARRIQHLSSIYHLYFLHLEPFFALIGTFLCFFSPTRFIVGTVPQPALSSALPLSSSPLTLLLLANIGSLYALFAVQEGLVLRATRDATVWRLVVWSMVVTDVGHLYAVGRIAPERLALGVLMDWEMDEWVNYGSLVLGLLLRGAFLSGWGVHMSVAAAAAA